MNRMTTCTSAFTLVLVCSSVMAGDYTPQATPGSIFAQLDTDGNRILQRQEIDETQLSAFERLLRLGDRDKDGQLSQEEYQSAWSKMSTSTGYSGVFNDNSSMFDDLKRYDSNGDGKVAKSEIPGALQRRFEALFERFQSEEIDLKVLEQRMKRFGQMRTRMNNNGNPQPPRAMQMMNNQEMQAPMQRAMNNMPAQSMQNRSAQQNPFLLSRRLIEALDTNRNGQLDSSELERASELLRKLDRNRDRKVDTSELSAQ